MPISKEQKKTSGRGGKGQQKERKLTAREKKEDAAFEQAIEYVRKREARREAQPLSVRTALDLAKQK